MNSSDDACAQDTSPTLPEGIDDGYLILFRCNSLLVRFLQTVNNDEFTVFYSYRSVGKVFCTMDGHGSMVHIHPSSSVKKFFKFISKQSITISWIYTLYWSLGCDASL